MRNSHAKKRIILPDPRFNDEKVTKFVNNIMLKGKKNLAFEIFYKAIDIVSEKTGENGLEVWKKALENVTPSVEVKSKRVGGTTLPVPEEIKPGRKQSVGMKNLISFARKRHEQTMADKEIMAAYKSEGAAFKKKEEIHRMAEANKAFAHMRM